MKGNQMADVVTNAVPDQDALRGTQLSERFNALTPSQQTFVLAYLGNGDATAAVKRAYQHKSDKSAKVMTYQVLQNPNVADFIAEALGKSEKEIQIAALRRDLRKAKPGSYYRARFLSMYLRLTGLLTEAEAQAEEKAAAELAARPKRSVGRPRKSDAPLFGDAPNVAQSVLDINDAAPKFYVGQLVTERDDQGQVHTGRVLSVGADGRPSEIEEVR
jgi:hypothetical protein